MSIKSAVFSRARDTILRINYQYPRSEFAYATCLERFAGEEVIVDNLLRFFQALPGFTLPIEVKQRAAFYQSSSWENFTLKVRRYQGLVYLPSELFTFVLADLSAAGEVYPETKAEREVLLELILHVLGFETLPTIVDNELVDTLLIDTALSATEVKNVLCWYVYLTNRPANVILSQGVAVNSFTAAPLSEAGQERVQQIRAQVFE